MEERIQPTKSGLFSIELLLCVGVRRGLHGAELTSRESAELFQAAGAVLTYSGGSLEDARESLILRLIPVENQHTGTLTVSNGEDTFLKWNIALPPNGNADNWEAIP